MHILPYTSGKNGRSSCVTISLCTAGTSLYRSSVKMKKTFNLEERDVNLNLWSAETRNMNIDKSLKFFKPQFPHL
jgi:hypothetical protein